ncbi:MAG: amidohydrolase family protein [Acidobacteria bacterium]|nr:amidohydrolase family protein [Acidobacteriota bacterium]
MKRRHLLLAAAGAFAYGQTGSPGFYAIQNAMIHPASGPAIPNGTIVVRNGLIEAVGPSVPVPAGAWTIDGKGLHVYPGLIDALSTWGLPAAAPAAARPATPAADAPTGRRRGGGDETPANVQFLDDGGPEDRPSNTSWLKAGDLVQPADATLTAARNAGFTTAIVFPSTGVFAGQGSAVNLSGGRAGDMVVGSPVGQYVTLPTRSTAGFPASLMGSIAYVRQIYIDAEQYKAAKAMYAQNARGLQRPAYDRALEGVLESPRILLPATRKVDIDRMIRFGKELKIPVVLYGGAEAWRAADSLKASGVPILLNLKWPEHDRDGDPDAVESLRTLETRELAPSGAAALSKAGVRFAFYTTGLERPADVRRAVKRAVDAGLSNEEALRAMTLGAAEIYGVDDRLGSLENGKIANLFVTDGDWLAERTNVKMVFVDGKKFEPAPAPAGRAE